MTVKISGVVITYNEERQIAGCLASLAWADERLVLDSGSTDRTVAIVKALGCRLETRPFTNFAEQRNAALALASGDWVFFLDADERVSPKLAQEIRRAAERASNEAGFWAPRHNWILGHRMRGGGWWPDDQLRLLRRGAATYATTMGVHEVAELSGPSGRLTTPIEHDNYQRLGQLFAKQDRYSRHAAEDMAVRGLRAKPQNFFLQPVRAFHRRFIQWHGYRDGLFGAFLAGLLAWYELVTYARLRRLNQMGGPSMALTLSAGSGGGAAPARPAVAGQRPIREPAIPPAVSAVIVSWNVRDLLRDCLRSLRDRSAGDQVTEIVVVDNGSTDGTSEMVRAEFPAVRLLLAPDNPGFAVSNNRGAALTTGDYLLLLNPDTVVRPGAIAAMLTRLEHDRGAGAAGPRLVESDGSTQSSRRRFPTFPTFLVQSTPIEPLVRRLPGALPGRLLDVLDFDDAAAPAWLVGACLLIRREVWEATGGLDEAFFMYFEETDWFKRAAQLGWRAAYVPEAEVVHYYGKSSEQNISARHLRFNSSKVQYAEKHHGALAAKLLGLYLKGMFVQQAAEEGVKWLIGHKRPLRRQRLSEITKVLRTGWSVRRPRAAN